MRVYTYYQPLPGLYSEDSQRRLLNLWSHSWRKQGWEPIVLHEGDAMLEPWYLDFKARVAGLPSEYHTGFDYACFARWAAMAAQQTGPHGGGLLVDYDVINYAFKPVEISSCDMRVYTEPTHVIMGCVSAPRHRWREFCRIFETWQVTQEDFVNSSTYHGYHVSDLSVLTRMIYYGNYPRPEWLQTVAGVHGHYPRPTFRTHPLVHFGYETISMNGNRPKWETIPKLRAL